MPACDNLGWRSVIAAAALVLALALGAAASATPIDDVEAFAGSPEGEESTAPAPAPPTWTEVTEILSGESLTVARIGRAAANEADDTTAEQPRRTLRDVLHMYVNSMPAAPGAIRARDGTAEAAPDPSQPLDPADPEQDWDALEPRLRYLILNH